MVAPADVLELVAKELAHDDADPVEGLLSVRVGQAHNVRADGTAEEFDRALIRLASACCLLVAEHRRLRAA